MRGFPSRRLRRAWAWRPLCVVALLASSRWPTSVRATAEDEEGHVVGGESAGGEPVDDDDDDGAPSEDPTRSCWLEPLEASALATVERVAGETLTPKLERSFVALFKDPCASIQRGLVLMACKLRNTADPLAAFSRALLSELDAAQSAEVWELVPGEARTWMLKALVAALPCTVSPGGETCDEADTNALLARYEDARNAYTRRALAVAGMPPFPTDAEAEQPDQDDDDDSKNTTPEAEVRAAMRRYSRRLDLRADAADWLASQFKPAPPAGDDDLTTNTTTIVEPAWFADVAARCRLRARSAVPDAPDASTETDLSDLDAAVRLAAFAWHYKTCHRDSVLYAFEHKDDDVVADAKDSTAEGGPSPPDAARADEL